MIHLHIKSACQSLFLPNIIAFSLWAHKKKVNNLWRKTSGCSALINKHCWTLRRNQSSSFHSFWRREGRWHFQTVPALLQGAGDEEKSTCLASCHPIIITLLHHKDVHTSGQGCFSDLELNRLCAGTLKSSWCWYYNYQSLVKLRRHFMASGEAELGRTTWLSIKKLGMETSVPMVSRTWQIYIRFWRSWRVSYLHIPGKQTWYTRWHDRKGCWHNSPKPVVRLYNHHECKSTISVDKFHSI